MGSRTYVGAEPLVTTIKECFLENQFTVLQEGALTPLEVVAAALAEDTFLSDVTAEQIELYFGLKQIDPNFNKSFYIAAKAQGVFSGKRWIELLSQSTESEIQLLVEEGEEIYPGKTLLQGRASWKLILALERTLLNGLQVFSGIATDSRLYVNALRNQWEKLGHSKESCPKLYHTRKIAPLIRDFVLDAVLAGGVFLHRKNLSDRVLVKENHKYLLKEKNIEYADFAKFVVSLRKNALFEVENLTEALSLTEVGVKFLMLDNFTPDQVREAVASLPKDVEIEISGGLNLQNLSSYLVPGLQRISIGAVTHSYKALDMSLDWSL